MRLRGILLSLALGACGSASLHRAEAETVHEVQKKMGSRFEITAVHVDGEKARAAVGAAWDEIDRLERMISSWDEESATSRVNRAAGGEPVAVPEELFNLIRRSIRVSELTGGAFDITFASAGSLWDFKAEDPVVPEPAAIEAALAKVDYRRIELDEATRTVRLALPGMRIGFGAIGKGFAANRAVSVMKHEGIAAGVVNAGGDLMAFGSRENGSPWTVAIADPLHRDEVFAYLRISEQAVVTSGDYESFVEVEGVRYAHILDPRTGYPPRGVRSVTIVCPDGELADALATAVFVMGIEAGLSLVNRLNGIEALVVDDEGGLHFSENLESIFEPGARQE